MSSEAEEQREGPVPVAADGDYAPPVWARYAELAVAVLVAVLGVVILIDLQDIRVPKAFASVGPRVFPTVVGWGLVVLGCWYAFDILRGETAVPSADSEEADPSLPADWAVLGGLALTLTVYALLMKPAGFVIASSVLFVMATVSMGSRQYIRDLVIGIALSIVAYVAFSEWLGIRLPAGLLDRFL